MLPVICLINCSTSGKEDFIWTFHCAYQVTQQITTGIIPLEAISYRKGLTNWIYCVQGACRSGMGLGPILERHNAFQWNLAA